MIDPTDKQIKNAILMGCEYLGDGLFCRGDRMGYYTDRGFEWE